MLKSLLLIVGVAGLVSACCSSAPPPTPAPEGPANEQACQQRLDDATAYWSAVRDVNLSCAADTDCALVFTGNGCRGACQVAVNATGAPSLETAVKEADAKFCATFQADGCPFATPKCAMGTAYCNEGKCDVRF